MFSRDELSTLGVERVRCRTVLIVDDLAPNLDVLEAVLDDEYEIVRAMNGPEAMGVLQSTEGIDLIITDQRMPGQTGIEFLEQAAESHPDVARMVVTAYSDIPPIMAAIELGSVRRFLLKPWKPAEMLAAVRECLEWKEDRETLVAVARALTTHIDALKEAVDEQQRTLKQVAIAERTTLIGRMTAGVTHDLRNQLAVLQLLVERLMEDSADPEIARLGNDAMLSLQTLLSLVRDVHSFARRMPLQLSLTTLSAEELVRDVLRLASLEDPGLASRIEVDVAPADHRVSGDPQRLQQALLAILRNAAEASAPGTPITLRIAAESDATAVEVRDRGFGMTREARAHALEPLWSGFGGGHAGLGLTIASMVARAHGGGLAFLDVEEGALVRMTLGTPEAG